MKRMIVISWALVSLLWLPLDAFAQEDAKQEAPPGIRVEMRGGRIIIYGPDGEIREINPDMNVAGARIGFGEDDTPWLGVMYEPTDEGIRLNEVFPDSPAEKAGLKTGDIVTEGDGRKMAATEDLRDLVSAHKIGDLLKLKVNRDAEKLDIEVKVGRRPEQFRMVIEAQRFEGNSGAQLGIECEDTEDGIRVKSVAPDSPAEKAGVRVGDILLGIDGRTAVRLTELRELLRQVRAGQQIELNLKRDGEKLDLKLVARGYLPPPVGMVRPMLRMGLPGEVERLREDLDAARKEIEELKRQVDELKKRLDVKGQ